MKFFNEVKKKYNGTSDKIVNDRQMIGKIEVIK